MVGSFGKVRERKLKRPGKQISKLLLGRWEGGRPKGKEGEQFPPTRNLCIYVIILVI